MQNTDIRPIDILIVEDNQGDARLILEVLKDAKVFNLPHIVRDGVEAINYLKKKGEYANADSPDLILLDLNLPKKDGREVLSDIKSNDLLKKIPVVIMTISQAEEDIVRSYNLHANCYITKPIDLNQFVKVVKSIEEFWFSIVKLPPK